MTASRDLARSRWRDFRRLWAGESVSLLGNEVAWLAIPLTAVVTFHASAGQLGLLGAALRQPARSAFGVAAQQVVHDLGQLDHAVIHIARFFEFS